MTDCHFVMLTLNVNKGGSINIDMIFIAGLAWLELRAVVQQQNCGWIKSY